MKKITVTMLLALCVQSGVYAQKYLDKLQAGKQGEGTVTISQSKTISDLVNGKSVTEGIHNDASNSVSVNTSKKDNKDSASSKGQHADVSKLRTEGTVDNADGVDTRKKVMRNAHKVTGYRVQVFSGGNSRADKIKAGNIGAQLKASFPNQPVYVHFYSPRWICRMGNFRSYQDAERLLKDVKAMGYGQACIVKGKITVHN